MIYLVDIGNTHLRYTNAEDVKYQEKNKVKTGALNEDWLDSHWQYANELIISNVNKHSVGQTISLWAKKHQILVTFVQSEAKLFGVCSGYDNPSQLGVDRWLALIGTKQLFPAQNCLIIDAGTAITVDLLSADGQHQGGWILAGFESMFHSLLKDTNQVKAKLSSPQLSFGKNTSDNVNHACWAALIGLIHQAYQQAETLGFAIDNIVLTGGSAASISQLLNLPHNIINELIFIGLKQYAKQG